MGSWPGLYHLDPTNGNEGAGGAVQVLRMQRQVAEEVLITSAREVTMDIMRGRERSGEERSRASGWTSGLSLLLELENKMGEGRDYMLGACRPEG